MTRRGRYLLITLAVVAAGSALAPLLRPLAIRAVAERARRELTARAAAGLRTPVTLGPVEVSFLPTVLVMHGLRLEGDGAFGLRAGSTLTRLEVRGDPRALLDWGSRPVGLYAERPDCRIALASAGGQGPASPGSGPPGAVRDGVVFPAGSTLTVRRGHVRVEAPGGVSFECEGFGLDTSPAAPPAVIAGRLGCTQGVVRSPFGDLDGVEGQAGFAWSDGSLRLDPLILHGDGLDLSASGEVQGGAVHGGAGATGVEARGSLAFDLARAATWLPAAAAPGGRIEIKLDGGLGGGHLHGQGSLAAPAMRLYGLAISDASGQVTLGDAIRFHDLKAGLLGGTIAGGVDLGMHPGGGWDLRADFHAERLDAARLLALASWSGPPISGVVSYKGRHALDSRGLRSLTGGGDFAIAGRFRTPQGDMRPFDARCATTTTGTSIALADGTVRTGGVEGRFDGTIAQASGLSLRLRGAAGRLGDLLPLFRLASPTKPRAGVAPAGEGAAAGGGAAARGGAAADGGARGRPIPVRLIAWGAPAPDPLQAVLDALGGGWEWDGDLRYDGGRVRFDGRIAGKDLTWHGTPIGSLAADVLYAGDHLEIRDLRLTAAGGGAASMRGTIDFRPPGQVRLEGDFQEVPVPLLLALAGQELPVEGQISGHAAIGGTTAAPEGQAAFETGPLKVRGVTFDALHGGLEFKDGMLTARDLVLTRGEGAIRFDGMLATEEFTGPAPMATIEAHGLDLALLGPWPGDLAVTGTLEASGRVQGTVRAPEGHIALRMIGVGVAGLPAGDIALDLDLEPGGVRLSGSAPSRTLSVSGRAGFGPGLPIDLRLEAGNLALKGPEMMPGIPEDVVLTLAGRAKIEGPAARPREIGAQVTLDVARIAVAGAAASAEGPVQATLQDGRLVLEPTVLTGSGTRIDLRAGVDLDPDGQVDLQAHGGFDLALARTFVRGFQAEGGGDIELSMKGPRRDPAFSGSLRMQAPRVRYPDLPFPINDLDARLAFDGISARIETLTCIAGGGRVVADGQLLLGTSGVSRGLAAVLAADVGIHGRDVSAEMPAGFRSLSDFDLRLVYDPTGAEIGGEINFARGVYARNFRIETSILSGKPPAIFDLKPPTGPLAGVRLNLALRAPDQIWVRNDFGRIEGQVDLHVGGTAQRPAVTGRVTALDGSTIDFNRVRYQVLSGTIDFDDPETINPVFNLNAETSVAEYEVGLVVEGTVDRFRYELTSNPPLPQADIVSLLLTGRPIGTFGTPSSTISPENVSAYLAGQLGQQLSSRFLGRVAPDVIAIDPLEAAAQGDPTTRITVGKQITPDLRVTYTDVLGTNQGTAYQLDYRMGRNISFASEHSSTGAIGGDFRYVLEGRPPILPGESVPGTAVVTPVIGAARVEGEAVLPEKTILHRLRLEPGRKRSRAKINERVDKLLDSYHRKGYLMAEVDVRETPAAAEGTIDMVVRAEAGPRVHLDIKGTRGAGALRDQIAPLWQQTIFLEDTVEDSRTRIESQVQGRGWRRATVTASLLQNEPTMIHARFDVNAGPRAHVKEVRIEGTRQISADEARRVLRTRPDRMFTRGIVRDDRLSADTADLRALYVSRGFEAADVDPPRVDLDEAGRHAVVTFVLHEGPRVSVRHVRFTGAAGMPEERLEAAAALPEGVAFTADGADAAAARIRRTYDGSGWPDARVRWIAEPVGGDEEAAEKDLVFAVEEGVRQSIADVTIAGNAITNDIAIRRHLTIVPHEPLSRVDLLASQTRLYRLGVFRSVDLRPAPLPKPPAPVAPPPAGAPPAVATTTPTSAPGVETSPEPAATPEPAAAPGPAAAPEPATAPEPAAAAAPAPETAMLARPLEITVREAPAIRQSFGVGYDTIEKIRGLYEIAERNLFGSARYLGLQMRASSIEQRASILYREQGLWGGRYDLLGSAFGIDQEQPAFTGRTVGIAGQLDREIGRATRLRYRYALKDVNPTDMTGTFEGSTLRLASVEASGTHDTRDVPFGPLRGHYFAVDLQAYGRAIGSEAQFAKAFVQAYTFKEVASRTVWAQAVRLGAAIPFGLTKSDPTSTGDAVSGIPQTERFYAGGDTTLRGFGYQLAGPLDDGGDPIGGEGLFLLNEELRFPIYRNFQGVVFTDIGNVYRTLSDYTLRDLRECAGAGLRLMTPIGPFRMEYGALLDRRPGEEPGQFFISIGQAF